MPNKEKTTMDIVFLVFSLGVVGFISRAIRYARDYGSERPFNWGRFVICTISASFVSVLIGLLLDGMHIDHELILAVAGATGYVGGPLLDMAYDEILETIKILFDSFQNQIRR